MANAPRDDNFVPALLGVSTADGETPLVAEIDPDSGGIVVKSANGLLPNTYDYVAYTDTSTTVDTYKYYSGGSGGTLEATITITYTDSTKAQVSTIART